MKRPPIEEYFKISYVNLDIIKKVSEYALDLESKLDRIKTWCEAYPLEPFPEPDMKKVETVLKYNGLSLGAVSASNMRHVLKGVQEIIDEKT